MQADHTVLSWGANSDGQLGNETTATGTTPTAMTGVSHIVSVVGGANGDSVLLIAD